MTDRAPTTDPGGGSVLTTSAGDGGRPDRIAVAILVAMAIALVVSLLGGEGSHTVAGGRLGGDFPEFYGAGLIVRAGDAADLYEADRQASSQVGLFGDETSGYLDFAYPPVVALAYAPLSAVPYRVAYGLHVALMVGFLWVALRLVRPMVPIVGHHFPLVMAAAVGFFPMFRALGGGQNTALTLLLLAGAWRALHDDDELLAGVCLGALLYKPQLAILFLAAPIVSRRWRVVAGACLSALALWALSAATMGVSWVGPFLRHGLSVPSNDGLVDGGRSVSLIGTAHRFDGSAGDVLALVATVTSAALALTCLVAWRRCDRRPASTGDDGHRAHLDPTDIGLGFALLAAGTVLASPHVIFYDAGLLVVVGLHALRQPTPMVVRAIAVLVVVSFLGSLDDLRVNPLAALAAGLLGWLLWRAWGCSLQPAPAQPERAKGLAAARRR